MTDGRIRLLGPLLAVLLQADDRKAIAASLAFLSALARAADARFTREYVALLDRPSTVAGHARGIEKRSTLITHTPPCGRLHHPRTAELDLRATPPARAAHSTECVRQSSLMQSTMRVQRRQSPCARTRR